MANKIIWYEVIGKDGNKLRKFYSDMFGWKYREEPGMDYGMTDPQDTGIAGGVGTVQSGASWAGFYVGVEDVEKALRKAEQLGGKVVVPTTKLPDVTFAVFADPEGHTVGLAQHSG
jgi:predicted enzyme related to lactoylglutathione lyase